MLASISILEQMKRGKMILKIYSLELENLIS